jgi:DNA-binding NtrC family response regulator
MSMPLNKIEPTPLSASGLARASSRDQSRQDFERFLEHAEALLEPDPSPNLRAWTDLAEAWRISQVLGECNGNRSAAARKLGIGRRTLYAKMDKLGITSSWNF